MSPKLHHSPPLRHTLASHGCRSRGKPLGRKGTLENVAGDVVNTVWTHQTAIAVKIIR